MCFWVRDTVLIFEIHNSSAINFINFNERSGFFFRILIKEFLSKVQMAISSIAIAENAQGISENIVL